MKIFKYFGGVIIALVLLCCVSSCTLVAIHHEVAKKNISVSFYGQILDQDRNAIPDVDIRMSVRHWYETVPGIPNVRGEMVYAQRKSGADGRFDWTSGASGDVLSIESIIKEGYILSPKTSLFLGPASGSYQNPIIFHMWKKNADSKP